jgi:hypothetical protein
MIKEEFKSNPGSFSVSANRDQLEKHNPKITIDDTLIPVLEKYDWWETLKAIPDETSMRTSIRKNRVIAYVETHEEAIELYNLLRRNGMVALRNWLD